MAIISYFRTELMNFNRILSCWVLIYNYAKITIMSLMKIRFHCHFYNRGWHFFKKNSWPKIPVAIAISLLRGEEAKGKCARVCILQGKGKCWLAVMFPECSTVFSADLAQNMWLILPWLKQSALIIIVCYSTNAGGGCKAISTLKNPITYISFIVSRGKDGHLYESAAFWSNISVFTIL